MRRDYRVPMLPLPHDLETKRVLLQLNRASRRLGELKGVAPMIPNETILLETLVLQEARESSAVENIVTTQDDLFRAGLEMQQMVATASAKEVLDYRHAMRRGFERVRQTGLLTCKTICEIQSVLVKSHVGFRKLPGTSLINGQGEEVYAPPQQAEEIERLMVNLERFINDESMQGMDPLLRIAIIHHQFESIHPFYDGNGRTGRIMVVLCLVLYDLLALPILYLSRYITRHKGEYYRLLQAVRDAAPANALEWEDWVLFILKGIEVTAADTIDLIKSISSLMGEYEERLRQLFRKQYRHELLSNLFSHPYTKIEHVEREMMVQRKTASKYLNQIVDSGLLVRERHGNTNYYMNTALIHLFMTHGSKEGYGSGTSADAVA